MDGNASMLEVARKKDVYKEFITAWMGNTKLPIPDGKQSQVSRPQTCGGN